MDPREFTADAPGRLVPIHEGGAATSAFLPHPLPRRMALGPKTIAALSRAENAIGRLQGAVGRMVNPFLIGRPLLRREAILSSRMEGTKTTAAKLVSHEAHHGETVDHETREVGNYISAMNRGVELLVTLPICLRLIRELHANLLDGVRGAEETPGRFRAVQNYIGHAGLASARFVPPPPDRVEDLLNDLERYFNEEESDEAPPLLVRIALAHYQFETIHPFRDGNGRVGRLLIPLALLASKRMTSPTLYLSSHFERHKRAYIDLMLGVSQRGEFEAWVAFFLEAVAAAGLESIERADALLALRDSYHQKLHHARSSALTLKLVDALFELPLVNVARTSELLDVTPATAIQHIKRLVEANILVESTGRKRDRQFLAPALLDVLQTEEPQGT